MQGIVHRLCHRQGSTSLPELGSGDRVRDRWDAMRQPLYGCCPHGSRLVREMGLPLPGLGQTEGPGQAPDIARKRVPHPIAMGLGCAEEPRRLLPAPMEGEHPRDAGQGRRGNANILESPGLLQGRSIAFQGALQVVPAMEDRPERQEWAARVRLLLTSLPSHRLLQRYDFPQVCFSASKVSRVFGMDSLDPAHVVGGTLCPDCSLTLKCGQRGECRLDVPGGAAGIVKGQGERGRLDQGAGNSRGIVPFPVKRQALFAMW